jgi:hypothetical protein
MTAGSYNEGRQILTRKQEIFLKMDMNRAAELYVETIGALAMYYLYGDIVIGDVERAIKRYTLKLSCIGDKNAGITLNDLENELYRDTGLYID